MQHGHASGDEHSLYDYALAEGLDDTVSTQGETMGPIRVVVLGLLVLIFVLALTGALMIVSGFLAHIAWKLILVGWHAAA